MTRRWTTVITASATLTLGAILGVVWAENAPRAPAPAAQVVEVNQTLSSTLRYDVKVLSLERLGPSATFGTVEASTKTKTDNIWAANITVRLARLAERPAGANETPVILDPNWFGIYANRPPQHKEALRCQIMGLVKGGTEFQSVQYSEDKNFQWSGKVVFVGPEQASKYYLLFLDSQILEISGGAKAAEAK